MQISPVALEANPLYLHHYPEVMHRETEIMHPEIMHSKLLKPNDNSIFYQIQSKHLVIQDNNRSSFRKKRQLTIHKSPVEQRIVDKSLEHGHHTVTMVTQHFHDTLTRHAIVAVDSCHLSTTVHWYLSTNFDFYHDIGLLWTYRTVTNSYVHR